MLFNEVVNVSTAHTGWLVRGLDGCEEWLQVEYMVKYILYRTLHCSAYLDDASE